MAWPTATFGVTLAVSLLWVHDVYRSRVLSLQRMDRRCGAWQVRHSEVMQKPDPVRRLRGGHVVCRCLAVLLAYQSAASRLIRQLKWSIGPTVRTPDNDSQALAETEVCAAEYAAN